MKKLETKTKPSPPTSTPRVYSYIRFSTPEQSLGDSERRQLAMTKAFAEKKGLLFDETLRLADRGLSGYHGDHRKKGVLGKFLLSVESGLVPVGSILVVENADRLSREGAKNTLQEIIFKLWDNNITLQTLSPEECYDPGCDAHPKFIWLMHGLQKAFDESKTKSDRITSARNHARELARKDLKILTSRCPAWLTVENNKFVCIKEAQKTIKKIFDLKLKGIGKGTIARKLNTEGDWTPPYNKKSKGNGWRESYIHKILQNRAVIGEYQPFQRVGGKRQPVGEPILGYYPEIVNKGLFHTVQNLMKENRGKAGRTGRASNLFSHIIKCAYCGGSMHFADKGKPPKGQKYLVCDKGKRNAGCSRHSIRYDECEKVILENCRGLKPDQVLPDSKEQNTICQSLRNKIQGYKAEIQDIVGRKNNLNNLIERTKDPDQQDEYEKRVLKLKDEQKEKQSQLNELETELKKAEQNLDSFARWQKDLISLRAAIKTGDIEIRMRLQAHLREFIEKIDVYSVGFEELYDEKKDNGICAGFMTQNKSKIKEIKQIPDIKFRETVLKFGGREQKGIIVKSLGYSNKTDMIQYELFEMATESDPTFARSKLFRNFVKEITKRRMSKDGRFLRIHFRSGAWIDIVPDGSLASGLKLYCDNEDKKMEYKSIKPDITRLYNEYKAGK